MPIFFLGPDHPPTNRPNHPFWTYLGMFRYLESNYMPTALYSKQILPQKSGMELYSGIAMLYNTVGIGEGGGGGGLPPARAGGMDNSAPQGPARRFLQVWLTSPEGEFRGTPGASELLKLHRAAMRYRSQNIQKCYREYPLERQYRQPLAEQHFLLRTTWAWLSWAYPHNAVEIFLLAADQSSIVNRASNFLHILSVLSIHILILILF